MNSIRLLAIPIAIAFCLPVAFGQETKTQDQDKALAKVAKRLEAAWVGDAKKTKEIIDADKNLDVSAEMIEMVIEQIEGIEVTFEDGTFSVEFGGQAMTGEWEATKLKKVKKQNVLMIKTVTDEDSGGEEKNFEIHFVGDKHIKMVDLDEGGPPIVLKKNASDKKDK